MDLTLTPSGGSATTLCSDGTRSVNGAPVGPGNLSINETPGVEMREYVGADRIHGERVKCDSGVLSFGVTRIFDTAAHAAAFALTGFGTEPREGALTAEVGSDTVTIFAHCVITSRESEQVGVAVHTRYTIEG